jgi:uracil-DNA glycosylase
VTALERFEAGLRTHIGRPAHVRPFVCEGSPLECRAFVVGSNPATAMELDYWSFWEPGYGFRKEAWAAASRAGRRAAGRAEVTPTRRMLTRVMEAAAPVRCLDTNVFATPTPSERDLPAALRRTGVFDWLLHEVRPAAVLAHGREAADHLGRLLGAGALPRDGFAPVPVPWGTLRVAAVPHLSRGWSYARAEALGRALREAAEAEGAG